MAAVRKEKTMDILNKLKGIVSPSAAPVEGEVIAEKKIGKPEIRKAMQILEKYRSGKAHLDARIVENEQFYRMRQWDAINKGGQGSQQNDVHSTAWLFSCIESRYADMMDYYPSANVRPRQADDKAEATRLTSILPALDEMIDMEKAYSDVSRYALKHGTFAYSVLWDSSLHNGLGDIAVNRVDLLSLYWEPGISDIQKSANVFHISLVDNDVLESRYPETVGKLTSKPVMKVEYIFEDNVDTNGKSYVVDWYYKRYVNGRTVLHYCKFVSDVVLYASEDDPNYAEKGFYWHGLYPYVVVPLFPLEGTIAGYGYIDISRDTQIHIDLLTKAIVENATMGASPRFLVSDGTKINEQELLDHTKKVVHVSGTGILDDDVMPMPSSSFNGNYINVLTNLVDQLKYTTANQDVNNGAAPSGVTAASALASLQEVGGKNARATTKTAYRAFKDVTYMKIELIRQFYDLPRFFRIAPDDNSMETYEAYDNSGLMPKPVMTAIGEYQHIPEFDLEISAEKDSPYRRMEMNELSLNFYGIGFFDPANADRALSALAMMEFKGKDDVVNRIKANGTIYQKLLQYQEIALSLAATVDPAMAESIAADIANGSNGALGGIADAGAAAVQAMSGGMDGTNEAPHVEKARDQARQSTDPN